MSSLTTQTTQETHSLLEEVRALYLDLMKRCVLNTIYGGDFDMTTDAVNQLFQRNLPHKPPELVNVKKMKGLIWPSSAHTMVGLQRLNNVQYCIEEIIQKNIPGDLIETGVWRGGTSIFMRAILKAYHIHDRKIWVADSFEGLPPSNKEKFPIDGKFDWLSRVECLAVSLEQVQENFKRYNLLDSQVHFLKGWFKDTLPNAPVQQLAVIRLDGDLYESTMDALTSLYPKLSPGGFAIIDDYHAIDACAEAVHDYRKAHNITETIHEIDGIGVYWQRAC